MNSLKYEKALIYDKRSYIQYYISLLKIHHLLIFAFYHYKKDYNSRVIKIFLFFLFFVIHITINTFFFNDDTVHRIYIDNGEFNFIYQIPQILYSSLISLILTSLIKYLALSEKNILGIKKSKSIVDLKNRVKKVKRILKVKFISFFIVTFVALCFFMYYVSCFCGIYANTQIHLIKDSVISFGASLIYPFGIYLIPGMLRLPSLSAPKKDKRYLYNFSKLFN